MQPEFTPGPWEVNELDKAVKIPVRGPGHVASAYAGTVPNAHLIGAATDMYGILAKISEQLSGDQYGGEPSFMVEVRAVLAKARGETA